MALAQGPTGHTRARMSSQPSPPWSAARLRLARSILVRVGEPVSLSLSLSLARARARVCRGVCGGWGHQPAGDTCGGLWGPSQRSRWLTSRQSRRQRGRGAYMRAAAANEAATAVAAALATERNAPEA